MTTREILIERDGYRAVLVLDETPHEPYDDGAVPQFTAYNHHGRWYVGCVQNGNDLPDTADELLTAWVNFRHRFDNAEEVFERYCRIVYGVDYVRVSDHHGYGQGSEFKLFEVAGVAWLDGIGWTEGKEEFAKRHESYKDVPELVSYVIGDVWGIVIEKSNRYVNVEDPEDVLETWDDVTSCWGFYGESDTPYFKEEAERMLEENMK